MFHDPAAFSGTVQRFGAVWPGEKDFFEPMHIIYSPPFKMESHGTSGLLMVKRHIAQLRFAGELFSLDKYPEKITSFGSNKDLFHKIKVSFLPDIELVEEARSADKWLIQYSLKNKSVIL